MTLIVDKVAKTRFGIKAEDTLATHDDPVPTPMFAEEVTLSGVDFKGQFVFLITTPADLGKFKPGDVFENAFLKVSPGSV